MTDLIRRADAIERIANDNVVGGMKRINEYRNSTERNDYLDGISTAIATVDDLPSAEAVQGEWIEIDNYYRMATCSHCHKVTMFEKWGEYTKPYNFCPNCGARMKAGDDK